MNKVYSYIIVLVVAVMSEPIFPQKTEIDVSKLQTSLEVDVHKSIDLIPFKKFLHLRHIEIIMEGEEFDCSDGVWLHGYTPTVMKRGLVNAQAFENYIFKKFKEIGYFETILTTKELENKLPKNYLETDVLKLLDAFLIADVGIYWNGCKEYTFELRILLPNDTYEITLLSIINLQNLVNPNRLKKFDETFNIYKQWLKNGFNQEINKTSFEEIKKPEGVKIQHQEWMLSNLNVSKFNNGEVIPEANSLIDWENAYKNKQPAWCYYLFNPIHGHRYGKLYNVYALIDTRGLAPEGWRLPSFDDWNELFGYMFPKFRDYNAINDETITTYIKRNEFLQQKLLEINQQIDLYKNDFAQLKAANANRKVVNQKQYDISKLEVEKNNLNDEIIALNNSLIFEQNDNLMNHQNQVTENDFENFVNQTLPYRSEKWTSWFFLAGTNQTNFNALPGGGIALGHFLSVNENLFPTEAYWWYINKDDNQIGNANMSDHEIQLNPSFDINLINELNHNEGFSIRCLKD